MRTTFLVGRLTPKSAEIVVVDGMGPSPIPGPWTLRAVVRGSEELPIRRRGAERVH